MNDWLKDLVSELTRSTRQLWAWLGRRAWLLRTWVQPRKPRPGRVQLNLDDGELSSVVAQIEEHPWMGGKKGAANLVRSRKGWIGAGSYDEVKREFARLCGSELARRRRVQEPVAFQLPEVTGLNQVWGSDLLEIRAWGFPFHVGTVLDVFNQEHLAIDSTPLAADSAFVADLFDRACQERGGAAPTTCTKTDRGCQYTSSAFEKALRGRTVHLKIPPGCPWFNGETERGNRDLKAVLYGLISQVRRPARGEELPALKQLCAQARSILNRDIARPALGNVTPADVAAGVDEEVRQGNRDFVQQQREQRARTAKLDLTPWRERLSQLFHASDKSTHQLLRFLNLLNRDYARMAR